MCAFVLRLTNISGHVPFFFFFFFRNNPSFVDIVKKSQHHTYRNKTQVNICVKRCYVNRTTANFVFHTPVLAIHRGLCLASNKKPITKNALTQKLVFG